MALSNRKTETIKINTTITTTIITVSVFFSFQFSII
jgi:hypothetical protein